MRSGPQVVLFKKRQNRDTRPTFPPPQFSLGSGLRNSQNLPAS